jgi:CDP-diacylglycerol--serine O-phosphatidyltransferase
MFVVCGALRLARFNVQKETQGSHEFKGLPIPAAASCIASLVLFSGVVGELDGLKDVLILILLYVLSFLMVSSIPYVSFKTFDLKNQKPFNVLVAVILILLVIAYRPKVMLPFVLAGYAFSGPVMALYRLRKERSRRRSGETTAPGMGGTFAKSASGAGEGRDSGSDAG